MMPNLLGCSSRLGILGGSTSEDEKDEKSLRKKNKLLSSRMDVFLSENSYITVKKRPFQKEIASSNYFSGDIGEFSGE